jgi:hypothetical protein
VQITPPFGGVLLRALLLLILVCLLGESLIRAGTALHLWREPLMGSVNAELDIKIQALDELSRSKKLDCIFLGSSQLDSAVNPEVFSREYFNLTGKNLNCYNFSLGTLTAGPAGKISRLLVHRYHPQMLIVGISARDFSRDFGELARPLISDPWIQFNLGNPNPTGWLLQNSMLFRFLSQIRTLFNPDYMEFQNRLKRELSPDGFLQLSDNNLTIDTTEFIPKFKLNAEDLSGMDEALGLKNIAVQVTVVEVPVHPEFLPNYVEGNTEKYFTMFRQPVKQRIYVYGTPFIYSQEDIGTFIPNSGWNDVKHLNQSGAIIFSRWLARKMVDNLPSENPVSALFLNGYGNN